MTAEDNLKWIRAIGEALEDENNSYRGFIQDITEQKEKEIELSEAKAQLEAAVKAGDVRTWEWHVPDDELVVGPEFAEIFGVDPDEAREGVSLDTFLESIHEDYVDRVERKVEEALDSCGEYSEEYQVWNDEGQLRWVHAKGEVECDDEGNPLRFPGAITDITERKRRKQKLEKREKSIREAYKVVADTTSSWSEKIEELLEVGRQLVETDYAVFSHITGDTYDFEGIAVSEDAEPHDELVNTADLPVYDASDFPVCRHMYRTGESLSAEKVEKELDLDDVELSCYIGALVSVEDRKYGTFCFFDTEPRDREFTEWEEAFIELLSDWVGSHLTRKQTIQELERQN